MDEEQKQKPKFCPMDEFGTECNEQCGWWNNDMGACSIVALGRMATYWMLNDSHDRMTPQERAMLRPRIYGGSQ